MLPLKEKLGPCVLESKRLRLEPLKLEHAEDLLEAGKGFDWLWMSWELSTLERMNGWISETLRMQERGLEYPFTVYDKLENKVVGSSRYMDVKETDKGVEIGWTWYSPRVWGTFVNPECKLLMLAHAFEKWGAIRVQLKTDNFNFHSQRAVLKLGAKFEGQLRNHRIRRDGTLRHTMMFSITKEEWPGVKSSLSNRIERT